VESNLIGVVETSIYLPSPPGAPSQKTSPSNARNASRTDAYEVSGGRDRVSRVLRLRGS